jgi:uncharacterized membrane protein
VSPTVRILGALALAGSLGLLTLDLAGVIVGPAHPAAFAARRALAPSCHQREERSLRVAGTSLPACARCSGLHASGAVGGLLLLGLPRARAWRRPPSAALLGLALGPLLLDVVIGGLWPAWDHPWLRALTGLQAGAVLLVSVGLRSPEPLQRAS